MELIFIASGSNEYTVYNSDNKLYTCLYSNKKGVGPSKAVVSDKGELLVFGNFKYSFLPIPFNKVIFHLVKESVKIEMKYSMFPTPTASLLFQNILFSAFYHFGETVSIFQNEKQVALFIKAISENNNNGLPKKAMKLILDDNLNVSLIVLFCLFIYSDFSDEHNEPTSFNIFSLKKRNLLWKPNSL